MIRYFTAGESHGPALSAIVEGMPAGVLLSREDIDRELRRRQQGYGRGGRMKIEQDRAEVLSGVRFGKTIGSPVALVIRNRDWENWTDRMAQFESNEATTEKISVPRPGHADLAGRLKYGFRDIRPVIDRSSARETAARVAAGSLARTFLRQLGIEIGSRIVSIGSASDAATEESVAALLKQGAETLAEAADRSEVRMLDGEASKEAMAAIDRAKEAGDTLGGVIEIYVTGVPMGLGSYVQHDRRLDSRLAAAVMAVQAIKGVEIGPAFENARKPGSQVHDAFQLEKGEGLRRPTNRAGGLEGSMSSGEPIVLRAAMKPISSMPTPLQSFDMDSLEPVESRFERSDTCAVPAAGVVLEAAVAPVVANALLEKLGGDHMEEIKGRLEDYRRSLLSAFGA